MEDDYDKIDFFYEINFYINSFKRVLEEGNYGMMVLFGFLLFMMIIILLIGKIFKEFWNMFIFICKELRE